MAVFLPACSGCARRLDRTQARRKRAEFWRGASRFVIIAEHYLPDNFVLGRNIHAESISNELGARVILGVRGVCGLEICRERACCV